jgi:hypothetical protein
MTPESAWKTVGIAEVNWLAAEDSDGAWTGYTIGNRPDAVWVLHAMFEAGSVTTSMTHDDVRHRLLDAGLEQPHIVGDMNLDEVSVVTGGGLGRSQHPGPGYRRLRWSEMAARLGEPVVPVGLPPCFRCLKGAHPGGSWPANITPPSEGSLDREGWYRLVDLLIQHSAYRAATECFAYFSPAQYLPASEEGGLVLTGRLGDAPHLYDHPFGTGSPANLWSSDRSWVTWSDWDLWGTKVSGTALLVDAILGDRQLEAMRLPWC